MEEEAYVSISSPRIEIARRHQERIEGVRFSEANQPWEPILTGSNVTAGMVVNHAHVTDLRAALDAALQALGLALIIPASPASPPDRLFARVMWKNYVQH